MLFIYIFIATKVEAAKESPVMIAVSGLIGVIVSIISVRLTYKKMREEHDKSIASKEYVAQEVTKVDTKLTAFKESHEKLHAIGETRLKEMHEMVQFLYQSEIKRNN